MYGIIEPYFDIRTTAVANIMVSALIKPLTSLVYSVKGSLLYYKLFGNKLKLINIFKETYIPVEYKKSSY